ncbi:MAG: metallopeptidase TldD-related protein [Candidatus Wallbacteria bacterium]|nr:metallopeptidase TldD-related protein [Candidatus Wallbacteria bacterium]
MTGERILQTALKGIKRTADKGQCRLTESRSTELNVDEGVVKLLRTTVNSSLMLQAIRSGKKGTHLINKTDFSSIKEAVEAVMLSADSAPADPAHDFAHCPNKRSLIKGPQQPDMDQMHNRLTELLADIRERYPLVRVREATMEHMQQNDRLVNSSGVDLSSCTGVYRFTVLFLAKQNTKTSSFNYCGCSLPDLSDRLINKGMLQLQFRQVQDQLNCGHLKGKFAGDILMSPGCLVSFIYDYMDSYLCDRSMISGTSLLRDKLGQNVAAQDFSLESSPVSRHFCETEWFNSDGFVQKGCRLIEDGVLKNFSLSLYGANKTGHKRSPNFSPFYIVKPGDASFDDMVRSVKRGLLLMRFSGGMPSVNGDFSGVAKNCYYIENGKIKFPVTETMVSGNLLKMFQNIRSISRERINSGSWLLPWMVFSGLTISGK